MTEQLWYSRREHHTASQSAKRPWSTRRQAVEANRRTVTPKAGGGWTVLGGSDEQLYRTKGDAERAARADLRSAGGGELVIRARYGPRDELSNSGYEEPEQSKH